jgi:hypothetical protein
MYWNGTDATNIYTGQGVMFDNKHGESGGTEYTDQFVAIAPDGSKVVYEGVDETTGQYATDIATAEGGTYVYNIKLEAFSTSGVTAPGAGTLLDSSANASRYVSGGIDGFNNSPLAFVDNGADVVYIVNSTPSPASGNDYATYEVAVDGSGSPSQLVDNVLVSGADDTGGNGFLCEEGYGSNTYALCDSSGDYTTTAFTLPSSTIMVAYSAQGGTVPTTPAPTPDINTFVGDGTIHPAYDGEVASTAGVGCPEHVISDSQGNIYLDDGCNTLVYEIPAVSGTYFGQSMSAGDVYVVAGDGSSGVYGYAGAGGPALYANFSGPQGLAVDAQGNLYLADAGNGYNYIDEVPNVSGTYFGQSMIAGDIYAIAGDGVLYGGYNGDGGPALSAGLGNGGIESLAVDAAGNVYATEPGDNVVREIAAANGPQFGQSMTTGDIYTVVGDGSSGHSGDGGPSTNAELSNPAEVAVDADGNLYISDVNNNVIREVYSGNGSQRGQSMTANDIYTVAGVEGSSCSGVGSGSGDGAAATSATFDCPKSVAVDANGDLFIGDIYGEVVREVPVASGSYFAQNMSANDIYTIAGDGTYGYSGDGGPALNAELIDPKVAVDPSGNLYIVDNTRVREVQP